MSLPAWYSATPPPDPARLINFTGAHEVIRATVRGSLLNGQNIMQVDGFIRRAITRGAQDPTKPQCRADLDNPHG